MKKIRNVLYLIFAASYLLVGVYLVSPYISGLIGGGANKEKANAHIRNLAANVGYEQELREQLERETDPVRVHSLTMELERLKMSR